MHVPSPEHRPPGHRLSNIIRGCLECPDRHTENDERPRSDGGPVSAYRVLIESVSRLLFCGFTHTSRSRQCGPGSDGLKRSSLAGRQRSAVVILPPDRCPCDDERPMPSPVAQCCEYRTTARRSGGVVWTPCSVQVQGLMRSCIIMGHFPAWPHPSA